MRYLNLCKFMKFADLIMVHVYENHSPLIYFDKVSATDPLPPVYLPLPSPPSSTSQLIFKVTNFFIRK